MQKLFISARDKHVYYYFQREKRLNLRFPTLLLFSISLTGPIPLRIQFLLLLPKRKFHSFLFYALPSLSFSISTRATLSLFLSFYARSRISRKRKKEEINDVAVTFNDLLCIILLPCLFLSTCC
jgi:hypothetical protein